MEAFAPDKYERPLRRRQRRNKAANAAIPWPLQSGCLTTWRGAPKRVPRATLVVGNLLAGRPIGDLRGIS